MSVASRCFLSFVFLQLCSAEVSACTVTQDGNQITYKLPDVSGVTASHCEYMWANESNYVLAHNTAKAPELVVRNSINTLVTSKCLDKIFFSCICAPEGESYAANCTTNCRRKAEPQGDKEMSNIEIGAIALAVVIILVALPFILCCKFKDTLLSCNQVRCFYTAVKMPNNDPKPADVEAGNV